MGVTHWVGDQMGYGCRNSSKGGRLESYKAKNWAGLPNEVGVSDTRSSTRALRSMRQRDEYSCEDMVKNAC